MSYAELIMTHDFQHFQATNCGLKLAIAKARFFAPKEFLLESGRLVLTLSEFPQGLQKHDLLRHFYPAYASSSLQRRHSFEVCLNKVIQRSRQRFRHLGINIRFCKITRIWKLEDALRSFS